MSRLTGAAVGDPSIEVELDEIRANLEHERSLGEFGYLDLFKPSENKLALRTWTGIVLQALQQLTGSEQRSFFSC